MNSLFAELGLVIICATGFALLARLFKQPPLIGYIITGIVLGPLGTRALHNQDALHALQQIGIALLLFLVGLELDWIKAREQLRTALALGSIQALGSFLAGLLLAVLTGHSLLVGTYIGLCLAFASTVIVVKSLSEGGDLNSLHGRISVGILLFQDFLAIIAITLINGFSTPTSLSPFVLVLILAVKLVALLALCWVLTQYILPHLFSKIAHSNELLFLCSLGWCFLFSISMTLYGFPLEVGALLSGITLASLPYGLDIVNRVRSLRDFFVIILFVVLGSSVGTLSGHFILLTVVLLLFTILGKPIITFSLLVTRGYTSRTAFLTALTQGQLSEFSLILVAVGAEHHHISGQLGSSITVTAIASLLIATILLTHRNWLYNQLRPLLRRFERSYAFGHALRDHQEETLHNHIIIFGYHRMGYHILRKLRDLKHQVIVVDFNPDIVSKLKSEGIECRYGDVQDEELLESLHLDTATLIISTIPHRSETRFLIEHLQKLKHRPTLIVSANHIDDALQYYQLGAQYVILPHVLGGEHVADLLADYEEKRTGELLQSRSEEIKQLRRSKRHALYFD
jgi:Kef-type K+ transport system membrane component KefB/voltage-gated potassium channel Kch